ncbi:hypothetical protein SRABI13_00455 [Erwinia aphidicola]|uniref:major capsid protein E n=1 Tax=Erwinia aphidicola TaxID=68334 RepID=UPI001D1D5330|nr:major capsid protein E [Erwinia aphidicola]CAH0148096.1 hypothetical protein SRABI13_00455 [Erwinia aphidicola]
MNFQDLFGGNTSIANSFDVPDVVNTVLIDSGLFKQQPHSTNNILLERQDADGVSFISTETMPYAQSDWSSAPTKKWDAFNYELIHSAITNDVSSRDLEQQLRYGIFDRTDQMVSALQDYSNRQYRMAHQFVESKLAEALFGGVARSTYAGQKDLNFFDAFGQTKTEFEINIADSGAVNIFEQLDQISRIIGVNLAGLSNYQTGMVIYATGAVARALKYHQSIKDFTQYVMAFNDPNNLITRVAPNLAEQRKWALNGVTVIDLSGFKNYEDLIGSNNFVAVPVLGGGASLFDLHTGIGTRHATEGQTSSDLGIHSYLSYGPRFGFPGCHTETVILPIVNQPQAIVYGSAAAE